MILCVPRTKQSFVPAVAPTLILLDRFCLLPVASPSFPFILKPVLYSAVITDFSCTAPISSKNSAAFASDVSFAEFLFRFCVSENHVWSLKISSWRLCFSKVMVLRSALFSFCSCCWMLQLSFIFALCNSMSFWICLSCLVTSSKVKFPLHAQTTR